MINKSQVKRILVVSLTNIGDVIMTIPVLSVLRAEFPDARIDLICGRAPINLFQGSSDLGKLFAYDKKWGLVQKWFWAREIAKEKYDLVVDLRHTLIPLLVGARYRTKMIRSKRKNILSAREKHLSWLKDLGLNINNRKPISLFSDGEIERLNQKLAKLGFKPGSRYAVVAPGGNSSTKRWTDAGFVNVIQGLIHENQLNVVLTGGQGEGIPELSGAGIFDLTGKTTLRELAALIAGAEVVLANDSSTAQLAQELGVRTAVIFGPTNHLKYAKVSDKVKVVRLGLECSPCEAAQCQIERRKCLDDLTPETVKSTIDGLMIKTYERAH